MTSPSDAEGREATREWYVSARHGRIVSAEGGPSWIPFGVHHARQPGQTLTACGVGALGWEIFWEMPYVRGDSESCPACDVSLGLPRSVVPQEPTASL